MTILKSINPDWPAEFADSKTLLATFKSTLDLATKALYADFERNVQVEELIQRRSDIIDTLLSSSWNFFFKSSTNDLCLIAVGGYGRRELLPHSDIDLLILSNEDCLIKHKEALEQFITFLWDTNLNIGHSVRTLDECAKLASDDITIATNLMESRVIIGNAELHHLLMPQIGPEKIWPSRDFFKAKWDEQIARHKKFNNTEYNLEPNLKTCPGGLRDIQMIGWVAKRHFAALNIDDLVTRGFLTNEEYTIMINGQSFLLKVRFALHMITHREEDRLLFDHQTRIAKYFGFEDTNTSLAVEQMMKQYYRWALVLSELNDMIMQLFDETILRACEPEETMALNPRFRIRNQSIETTNDRVFQKTPSALLEIFFLITQHMNILRVRASTIRQIRESRHLINEDFRNDPKNKQWFIDILRSPRRVASVMKLMHRYGILGNYLPAFGEIVGQSQHDLFHIYTVDAHTLNVLKYMRQFTYEDMLEKFPIASMVMKKVDKKDLLYLACIFHDIAKGRGGNHSVLGAEDAYQFCINHNYNQRDANMVTWLVKNHLLMSYTSQKKDISDPDVIQSFALNVGDIYHLDYLFVLTVADINGTNPALWNSWHASLLRQLYSETKRALRRGLENVIDKKDLIEEKMHQALEKLEVLGADRYLVELVLSNAGDDYFIRESVNDIVWQTEAISKRLNNSAPLILIRESPDLIFSGATQIFIHTKDRIHTFALVASALEQQYLSIVDARIYSSNSGYTLDTFFVLNANGEPIELTKDRILGIQTAIENNLTSTDASLKKIANRRTPRQLRFFSIPTQTSISHDEQKGHTALEVITADRPGLLASIGNIFIDFGIELINAKISTLGERVEDIFFITDKNHKPLRDPQLCAAIQTAIREKLDEQVAQTSTL
jgi:[protein-PII] uridylyltransferase